MHPDSDSCSESSRPITPSEDDCCHNECNPCIFDIHRKLLEEYERRKKGNVTIENRKNVLCSFLYKNFAVVDVKEACECYILLSLSYQGNESKNDTSVSIDPGQHVMLHLQDTTKPFTPIAWSDNSIDFLIRLYPNGKFSTHLRNVEIGDIIRIRGPYGNFEYKCNSFQRIIMFSMGSGITAIYPIAKAVIDNELEETKIYLVGGFRNISQIPLKKQLQSLSDYWNFKCTLYISQLHNDVRDLHGINVKPGRLNKDSVSDTLESNAIDTTLILICGTHEFNRSVEQWTRCLNYTHMHVFE